MLKSSFCGYSDAHMLAKGTITITGEGADDATKRLDERNRGMLFKNCAPFINCKTEINNTEIGNAKDIDIVMPMYNLIEYRDNCSKTSGSITKYYIMAILKRRSKRYYNTIWIIQIKNKNNRKKSC